MPPPEKAWAKLASAIGLDSPYTDLSKSRQDIPSSPQLQPTPGFCHEEQTVAWISLPLVLLVGILLQSTALRRITLIDGCPDVFPFIIKPHSTTSYRAGVIQRPRPSVSTWRKVEAGRAHTRIRVGFGSGAHSLTLPETVPDV